MSLARTPSSVQAATRTSIANGVPTLRRLQSGDLVMIDLHPVANGYASDLCHSVCVGKPASSKQPTTCTSERSR